MMKMPGNFVDPFTNPIYRLPGDNTPSTTIDEDPTTQEATVVEESTPVRAQSKRSVTKAAATVVHTGMVKLGSVAKTAILFAQRQAIKANQALADKVNRRLGGNGILIGVAHVTCVQLLLFVSFYLCVAALLYPRWVIDYTFGVTAIVLGWFAVGRPVKACLDGWRRLAQ